ncbi:PPM-type phosphatase domain-containing protein [Heracleum sosnowskyi]|uniref:PPM-type phosphatase domain-containing protein n=1 Tax=Heracleum sosnowskyi TaxID=360622 RepID=A0AAD8J3M0_9APIA|nr:PPM-type phosphatase domain-containing protein [Heracleum sosnowskyi]
MGMKKLSLNFKAFKLKKFAIGQGKRKDQNGKKASWMTPISHGFHVVEDRLSTGETNDLDSDSVVVQREENEGQALWFFSIFDAQIGDRVTKYMQSHLFDKKPRESEMRRKTKETIRKAYLGVRAKIRETTKREDMWKVGSASAIVINGEKLVLAHMGEYRTIVCKDGEAHQVGRKHKQSTKRHWSHKLFSGAKMPKLCIAGYSGGTRSSKSSEPFVSSEKIDSGTEFVVLASTGIWEVMKYQEAVNLIRHLDDPQEAAECLAKEALVRMSKSKISCLIIRFE